jgi:hypothetical protein
MDIDELCRIRWLVSSASELGRRNKRRGSSAAIEDMDATNANATRRMDLDVVMVKKRYIYCVREVSMETWVNVMMYVGVAMLAEKL